MPLTGPGVRMLHVIPEVHFAQKRHTALAYQGALAGPSEVLLLSTVKDLVADPGLVFEDRGTHELKDVPDRWHLDRATS